MDQCFNNPFEMHVDNLNCFHKTSVFCSILQWTWITLFLLFFLIKKKI